MIHYKLTRILLFSSHLWFSKEAQMHSMQVCAHIYTCTHKEFNLEAIIGAQRRTGKSYCYKAQIINHSDILLALSLYIPLK